MSTSQSPQAKRKKLSCEASEDVTEISSEDVGRLQPCCLACGCSSIALKPNQPRRKGRPLQVRHRCSSCRKFTGDTYVGTANGAYVIYKTDPRKYLYGPNEQIQKGEGSDATLVGASSGANQSDERRTELVTHTDEVAQHFGDPKSAFDAGPPPLKIKIAGGKIVQCSITPELQESVVIHSVAVGNKEKAAQSSNPPHATGAESTICLEEAEMVMGDPDNRPTALTDKPQKALSEIADASTAIAEGVQRKARSCKKAALIARSTDNSLTAQTGCFENTEVIVEDGDSKLTATIGCCDITIAATEDIDVPGTMSMGVPSADASAVPEAAITEPSVSVVTTLSTFETVICTKRDTPGTIVLNEMVKSPESNEPVTALATASDIVASLTEKGNGQSKESNVEIQSTEMTSNETVAVQRISSGRRRRPKTMRKQTGGRINIRRSCSPSGEDAEDGEKEVSNNTSMELQPNVSASDTGKCALRANDKDTEGKTRVAETNFEVKVDRKTIRSRNAAPIAAIRINDEKDERLKKNFASPTFLKSKHGSGLARVGDLLLNLIQKVRAKRITSLGLLL